MTRRLDKKTERGYSRDTIRKRERCDGMKTVIFDCDSTVGLPGKPMDDAMALFYLLGRPREVKVLGITCTFGNGTAAEVFGSTTALLAELGLSIPCLKGAEAGADPRSEAARFIVDAVNKNPGGVTLMAIGSLTNLYGASLLDPEIFEKTAGIILMGGYTAPLLYHGRHLEELNFSVNPEAAARVLGRGRNISILTGNNTLEPSYLPLAEFQEKLGDGCISRKCGYRFADKEKRDGEAASYCWDVVASVYLLHPELFEDCPVDCFITERTMHSGWLGVTEAAADTCRLNLPRVRDCGAYRAEMYAGWRDFQEGSA